LISEKSFFFGKSYFNFKEKFDVLKHQKKAFRKTESEK